MGKQKQVQQTKCLKMTRTASTHAGLTDALQLLKSVADDYDSVGYADLFQLASATGIQVLHMIFCGYLSSQIFL